MKNPKEEISEFILKNLAILANDYLINQNKIDIKGPNVSLVTEKARITGNMEMLNKISNFINN